MDALKRAEKAKQGQPDGASGLSLELQDSSAGGASASSLPDLPKLEDLDDEFLSHSSGSGAAPKRGSAQPDAGNAGRAAIRNAFAVKAGGNGHNGVVILAAVALVVLGGLGIWLWLELKPTPGLASLPSSGIPVASQSRPLAPPQANAGQTATTAQTLSSAPSASTGTEADDEDFASTPVPRTTKPTKRVVPRVPRAAGNTTPFLGDDAQIRVTSGRASAIDPGVSEGYRLLLSGNLPAARSAYSGALRNDPRNTDAIHGVAAISLREGKTDDAATLYRRILEVNPADATALAALSGLNGQGDPVAEESRMKSLLAVQGDQPAVNFALGNLYARQQRWTEAQQAYFKAVTADGSNPDYLFNLAVSLDQINKPKLAEQYYEQALKAAHSRPAAFDTALASRRLSELKP